MDYVEFLKQKQRRQQSAGIEVPEEATHQVLFPFQRAIVRYALRKGRAAVFADTGLGKTFIQLEWCRLLKKRALIIAPLSVARQTIREARKIDIEAKYIRSAEEAIDGINITNYEMFAKIGPKQFDAVVLDESSILKALDGSIRSKLIATFQQTPYRLACTATPAPNDITEIGNHAQFLGVATHAEMLSQFFVHDASSSRHSGWRLKGHAIEPFYRWLASWALALRKPSDLGFDDAGYNLPPLTYMPKFVKSEYIPDGQLFHTRIKGITDRCQVRRSTMQQRCDAAAELIKNSGEQWIAWVGLNDEGRELARQLDGDSVLVEGQQDPEEKALAFEGFQDGKHRVLITKPKIGGFGMNFQCAARMVFVGLSDSWESYYQCVRRSWRFGQKKPVDAHVILSEPERPIWENVMSKEDRAKEMVGDLIRHVRVHEQFELGAETRKEIYKQMHKHGEGWKMYLGDCIEEMLSIPDNSIGLAVFSPPFSSLYTYTDNERDMGNSKNEEEFAEHFRFFTQRLMRVLMPGRLAAVHVAQILAQKQRDGYIGMKDFRGDVIRCFIGEGWYYHGEVCIDKNPQAQAIRSKSRALLFVSVDKDQAVLSPGFADYVLLFRKPGENPEPIQRQMTTDQWIEWAHPVWYGIRETETLNVIEGREEKDERHICPLQLGTIERCITLWSNPGDTVLSPFAGIGSEGFVAVKLGRKFIGIELKESYYNAAIRNLERARAMQETLFNAQT